MPNWIILDDMNSQIGYWGSWSILKGSTRQREGGVHSTTEPGASCGLSFRGVGIVFIATVPRGSGNQVFDYQIDNRAPVRISTPQQSVDDYDVELIRVEDLPDDVHTIILTNVGGAPFQVDVLKYWPANGDSSSTVFPPPPLPPSQPQPQPSSNSPPPLPLPQPQPEPSLRAPPKESIISGGGTDIEDLPSSSPTSSSLSEATESLASPSAIPTTNSEGLVITRVFGPTVTERIVTSTDGDGQVSTITITQAASPHRSTSPSTEAIIGIAVGAAVAMIALLVSLFLCHRRRRARAAWDVREVHYPAGSGAPRGFYVATHSSADVAAPFNVESPSMSNTRSLFARSIFRKGGLSSLGAGNTLSTSGLSYTSDSLTAVGEEPPPPAYVALSGVQPVTVNPVTPVKR